MRHLPVALVGNIVGKFRMRRQWISWILYDIASSGYILLISAVAFPLYFKMHVTANAPWSDSLWGLLLSISTLLAGVVAPVVGTAADISGHRLRYLAVATAICCAATGLLAMPAASVALISVTFCISFTAYLVAAGLYDSLLKTVAPHSRTAWLSNLGWGLGYLGGLVCYFLAKPFLDTGVRTGDSAQFANSFVVTALYYGAVGGIALFGLRTTGRKAEAFSEGALWSRSAERVAATTRGWRKRGGLARVIVGIHLITGAAATLAFFTPIILTSHFSLSVEQVTRFSAVFSIVSIGATIFTGWLALRIDPLRLLLGTMPVWLLLAMLLIFGASWWAGLATSLCLGLAIGPTNAIGRSIVAAMIQADESAQMFGFGALINRAASAIGPLFFGVLSSATGLRWPAVTVTGAILLLGFAMMHRHRWLRTHLPASPERRPMDQKA
jgi:UMF1 family MFS transporter